MKSEYRHLVADRNGQLLKHFKDPRLYRPNIHAFSCIDWVFWRQGYKAGLRNPVMAKELDPLKITNQLGCGIFWSKNSFVCC